MKIITGDSDKKPGYVRTLEEFDNLENAANPVAFPEKWRDEAHRLYVRELEIREHTKDAIKPTPTACNRCGACCLRFTINWSPDRLRQNYDAWISGKDRYEKVVGEGKNWRATNGMELVHTEAAMWYPALIPIDAEEATKDLIFKDGITQEHHPHWYRCRYVTVVNCRAACYNHRCRPYTCWGFKPKSMGGYLSLPDMIYHPECSYRTDHDWQREQEWLGCRTTFGFTINKCTKLTNDAIYGPDGRYANRGQKVSMDDDPIIHAPTSNVRT